MANLGPDMGEIEHPKFGPEKQTFSALKEAGKGEVVDENLAEIERTKVTWAAVNVEAAAE